MSGDVDSDAGVDTAAGSGGAGGAGGSAPSSTKVFVGGNGGQITVFGFDPSSGALTQSAQVSAGSAPSYLAIAPDKKHLYAVDENAGMDSSVIAFAVDAISGSLTEVNRVMTGGAGGLHLAVHPSGKWVVVTHYTSHDISVLPIADGGGVMEPSAMSRGPDDSCLNAHEAVFDHTGNSLFVPCLGSNYVTQYRFASGALSFNEPATVEVPNARHLALSPDEKFAYVLSESDSTITWFKHDAATGRLSDSMTIDGYENMPGSSAHILVHPNGRWLYDSQRLENTIGLFALDTASGAPAAVAFESDMLGTPRDFSIDPSGQYLIAANQDADQNLFVYRIAPEDGRLTRIQVAAVGGNPTCTLTVTLP